MNDKTDRGEEAQSFADIRTSLTAESTGQNGHECRKGDKISSGSEARIPVEERIIK